MKMLQVYEINMSWPASSLTAEVTQHAGTRRHRPKVAALCYVRAFSLSKDNEDIIKQQLKFQIYYFMFIVM